MTGRISIKLLLFFYLFFSFTKIKGQDAKLVFPNYSSRSQGQAIFSPDGKYVLTLPKRDGYVNLWEIQSGKLVYTLECERALYYIIFSQDGRSIVAQSENTVDIWETESGSLLHSFNCVPSFNLAKMISPNGKYILTIYDDSINTYELSSGKLARTLRVEFNSIRSATYSHNGKYLATLPWNGSSLKFYNSKTCKLRDSLPQSWFRYILYSPDGKYLIGVGVSGFSVWNASNNKLYFIEKNVENVVAISPNGKRILTGDNYSGEIRDIKTGNIIEKLSGDIVNAIFSPDGNYILTRSNLLYDSNGKLLFDLSIQYGSNSSSFSPDGKFILMAGGDKTAKIWETATGKLLHSLTGYSYEVSDAAFSPDGQYFIISADGKTEIWGTLSGKLLQTLENQNSDIRKSISRPIWKEY